MNARWMQVVGASMRARTLAALLAASTMVAWPGEAADASGPELIEALRANGAQVVSLGSRGGLDGYFVTPSAGTGYGLYVTGDGHAVAGLLYGPDGMEITGTQLAAVRPAAAAAKRVDAAPPEPLVPETVVPETAASAMTAHAEGAVRPRSSSSLTRLFERSAAAFGFTLGNRGPLAVLLGDATCPWSRSAVARLGRAALEGRLQIRVVPVAILGADAARRASAIAASADPARAWFEGPDRGPDRAGAERIARNNTLLDEWGATAVPLIAWWAPEGAVTHRIGDIDDVGAWLVDTLRVGDTRAGDGHE